MPPKNYDVIAGTFVCNLLRSKTFYHKGREPSPRYVSLSLTRQGFTSVRGGFFVFTGLIMTIPRRTVVTTPILCCLLEIFIDRPLLQSIPVKTRTANMIVLQHITRPMSVASAARRRHEIKLASGDGHDSIYSAELPIDSSRLDRTARHRQWTTGMLFHPPKTDGRQIWETDNHGIVSGNAP